MLGIKTTKAGIKTTSPVDSRDDYDYREGSVTYIKRKMIKNHLKLSIYNSSFSERDP